MTYGCHNSKREAGRWVQDGWTLGLRPNMVWLKSRMTVPCQYDMAGTDQRCQGCRKPPAALNPARGEPIRYEYDTTYDL